MGTFANRLTAAASALLAAAVLSATGLPPVLAQDGDDGDTSERLPPAKRDGSKPARPRRTPPVVDVDPDPNTPATNKVDGLEINVLGKDQKPLAGDTYAAGPSEQYVSVRARPAPLVPKEGAAPVAVTVSRVEWVVIPLGKGKCKVTEDYTEANDQITVGLPTLENGQVELGAETLIHAAALVGWGKDKDATSTITRHALLVLSVKGPAKADTVAAPPSPRPAAATDPAPLPAGARLHVVYTYDGTADLNLSALKDALSRSGSRLYAYNLADPRSAAVLNGRAGYRERVTAAGTPCIFILTGQGQLLGGRAFRLPLTKDYSANERILLDVVGRVAGGARPNP